MVENNFKVSVKDVADIYCAAVCGLDNEFDEIAYRAGDSVIYFKPKVTVHIPADTRSAFPVISVHSPVSIQCRWQS